MGGIHTPIRDKGCIKNHICCDLFEASKRLVDNGPVDLYSENTIENVKDNNFKRNSKPKRQQDEV